MNTPTSIDKQFLDEALATVFADWVRELDLRVLEARAGEVLLALPVSPKHVHSGGVMSGQTLMAAADTAMVLAVMSKLGAFRPMTTVQLQTTFLRPVPGDAGSARVHARVLRMGKSLAFGDIQITHGDDVLAAHATTTYALL
ncbi:MAG: PaaI family thioesterase [Burkholderiales bacterium]